MTTGAPPFPLENWFRARSLEGLVPRLVHGFSGSMAGPDGDRGVAPAPGTARFEEQGVVWLEQPHRAEILELAPGDHDSVARPAPVPGYDGAMVLRPGEHWLAITAADCVPVLAAEPRSGAFAALHAGWRGTAAGILPNLLARWRAAGIATAGIRLALGPAIGPCCFEVREDCLSTFAPDDLEAAVTVRNGSTFLDLTAVLAGQARAAGLSEGQIENLGLCTACHRAADGTHPFASYRRAKREGLPTGGRNLALIGRRAPP